MNKFFKNSDIYSHRQLTLFSVNNNYSSEPRQGSRPERANRWTCFRLRRRRDGRGPLSNDCHEHEARATLFSLEPSA